MVRRLTGHSGIVFDIIANHRHCIVKIGRDVEMNVRVVLLKLDEIVKVRTLDWIAELRIEIVHFFIQNYQQ